ncbi:MAG: hypothetical protein JWR76_148 [Mucilaginibacter sp.]|nr:hypothetical protein [Mucilaginibacter sp.]
MKTVEKNANGVQGTAAKTGDAVNSIPNRPSLTGKEAKEDEKSKNQTAAQTPQAETARTAEVKAGNAPAMDNKSTNAEHQSVKPEVKEEPKIDEPKAEIRYTKPALNLEQTLKSVNDLHRKSIQRLALIARIKLLEDFEVKLIEENDELETNPYRVAS